MIILAPYSEDPFFKERQEETNNALETLKDYAYEIYRPVVHNNKDIPSEYEKAILKYWGRDDLLVIEHDIVPTLGAVKQMETCPSMLCANDYPFHRIDASQQPYTRSSCRVVVYEGDHEHEHRIDTETAWADFVGLGFTRFRKPFMKAIKPGWKSGTWIDLDTRISHWTHEEIHTKWHVHRPALMHNHPHQYQMQLQKM